VTGYIVQIDDGLGGPFTQVQNSLSLQLTISNLRSGRSYRIKYAGRNIVYDQQNMFNCDKIHFSNSVLVLTAIAPGVPLALAHNTLLRYKTAAVVTWSQPIEDGGSPLISYVLSIACLTTSSPAIEYVISSAAFDYTFTGLTSGYQYSIMIKARSLVGDSEFTDPILVYAGV
jgi:hypothetical protein